MYIAGLLVTGCGGARTEPAQTQVAPQVMPASPPDAAPQPHAGPSGDAAQPSTDGWFRELIDPSVLGTPLRLQVAGTGLAVLVPGNGTGFGTLTRANSAWSARAIDAKGRVLTAAWQQPDVPWTMFDAEAAVAVRKGFDGPDETIIAGQSQGFAHDISTDATGIAHMCLSLGPEDRAKDFVYAARTGPGKAPWQIERLPFPIRECRIVATDDTVHIITTGLRGVYVLSKTRGDGWKDERWSTADGRTIAAARGPTDTVALAYSDGSTLKLKKRVAGNWQNVTTPLDAWGSIRALALAVSADDKVHVAVLAQHDGVPIVAYSTEGSEEPALIAYERGAEIELALDPSSSPHLLYTTTTDHRLVHARRRNATDPSRQSPVHIEPDAVLDACATHVRLQAGEQLSTYARGYTDRWCVSDQLAVLPDNDSLRARCDSGNANACLVGGIVATNTEMLFEVDITPCLARDACRSFFRRETRAIERMDGRTDEPLATKLLERGCELGQGAACLHAADLKRHEGHDASALLAKACNAGIALGCTSLLDQAPSKLDASIGQQTRSTLQRLCKSDARPEACNGLAYMEERGVGGTKQMNAALQHYARACGLGSPQSCARLLIGPFGKPPPPRGLDAATFEETLAARCELHGEEACLALSTAFETGWVVKRDRDRARAVLHDACDQGIEAACRRLGSKPRGLP